MQPIKLSSIYKTFSQITGRIYEAPSSVVLIYYRQDAPIGAKTNCKPMQVSANALYDLLRNTFYCTHNEL